MPALETRCDDVLKMLHPYLDGELLEADRALLDGHLQACATCRELMQFEAGFKAQLRARLRHDPAPAELKARVLASLDEADATGLGPTLPLTRRVAPFAAVFAIAAASVVFVSSLVQSQAGRAPIVEDAIHGHEKNLPMEVAGAPDDVRDWMVGKVSVPVQPPRLGSHASQASLVGGRVSHLSSRDAAQLVYQYGRAHVTVYVFDASGVAMNAPRKRVVDDHELYVDSARGYNVVFYRDHDVGYAFTSSDLDEDQLVQLVSASLE